MHHLNESLRHLDLKDTVLPQISIDEYQPKTGLENEVVVVAFYATSEMAAKDLSHFLEKGVVNTLDVDVSPVTDSDGSFLIFVEIKRSPKFWSEFKLILKDVEQMSDKLDWKVKTYLHPELHSVDDENLTSLIITDPENYMTKEEFESKIKESITNFFNKSDTSVDSVSINEGYLKMSTPRGEVEYKLDGIFRTNEAVEKFNTERCVINEFTNLKPLQSIFANTCSIYTTDKSIYIDNNKGDVLVLRKYY